MSIIQNVPAYLSYIYYEGSRTLPDMLDCGWYLAVFVGIVLNILIEVEARVAYNRISGQPKYEFSHWNPFVDNTASSIQNASIQNASIQNASKVRMSGKPVEVGHGGSMYSKVSQFA